MTTALYPVIRGEGPRSGGGGSPIRSEDPSSGSATFSPDYRGEGRLPRPTINRRQATTALYPVLRGEGPRSGGGGPHPYPHIRLRHLVCPTDQAVEEAARGQSGGSGLTGQRAARRR